MYFYLYIHIIRLSVQLSNVKYFMICISTNWDESAQGLYILIDRPGSRHRHLAIRTLYYTSSSVLL